MTHYTRNAQMFLVGFGMRRTVTTLCGLVLGKVEDQGSPSDGHRTTCPDCRRRNGEDRARLF